MVAIRGTAGSKSVRAIERCSPKFSARAIRPAHETMTKRQLRAFAVRDPKAFREYIRGARDRDLTARHATCYRR